MTQEFAVGIVPVYKTGDTYLFCLVRHAKGHWGFPKGHMEGSEGEKEAALRELAEETGVTDVKLIDDVSFSEQYTFEQGDAQVQKTNHYFLGVVGIKVSTTNSDFKNEIVDCVWLPYVEAKQRITFDESRRLLDKAWEYLNK